MSRLFNWFRCTAWTRHLFTLRLDIGHGEYQFGCFSGGGPYHNFGVSVYVNPDPHWHARDFKFIGVEVGYGHMYRWFGIKDSPSKCPGRS